MSSTIELANGRLIGDGHPCFIIAEAGSNWRMGTPERDLLMGRALIDVAVDTGCDAVKFQTYRSHTVYVENAGESDYLAEVGIKKSINAIFDDLSMPYELVAKLAAYCEERGILFMSTPFSVADADAVDPYVSFHKIASYEISHTQLLEHVAATGKPMVCSTGASTLEDVDFAVDFLRERNVKGLALMQCTAKYPAPLDSVNVRVVPTLKERYGVPVGLSDHSREPAIAPAAAVALGANLIEKHYTLHNALPGADHPFALTPADLRELVSAVRQTEAALGDGKKAVDEVENELASFARRGVQAVRAIPAGEAIRLGENVEILRPGKRTLGVHPRYLGQLGAAAREISPGEGVTWDAVTGEL